MIGLVTLGCAESQARAIWEMEAPRAFRIISTTTEANDGIDERAFNQEEDDDGYAHQEVEETIYQDRTCGCLCWHQAAEIDSRSNEETLS
jgi:hypothetical protein